MTRLAALRPAALAIAAILALGACNNAPSGSGAGSAKTAEPLTPVPAPAGLIGDLFVPQPAAAWGKARAAVGGPAIFLPQSFGGLAATLAGLPITMAPEIDEAVPLVGAAVRQGKGPLQAVVGVHVKQGDRFVDQLTRGEGARFNATVDAPSRVTILVEKVSPGAAQVALGVLGNYLLIAQKPADLTAVGPYVVRTLPTRPAAAGQAAKPQEDVIVELPEAALAGPVSDAVRELRGRSEGAAAALVPVSGMLDQLLALLGDAAAARVTVGFDPATVHARAAVTPKPGGGPGGKLVAEMAVGDAKPLLDLPDSTSLGVLWRESAAARSESAPRQAEALAKLLGDVGADDRAAITAALKAEAGARGDYQAIGIAFNGTGPTAVVRAPAADADHMKKALKQLVDLAALPTFKKALSNLRLKLSAGKAVVENYAGDVTRVRLARLPADDKGAKNGKPGSDKAQGKPEPAADVPEAIDLLYTVNEAGLFASAGFDPKDSFLALAKALPGADLGHVAPMAGALADVRDASFILVADALRINAMTTGTQAPAVPVPLVIAAGRDAQPAGLWTRLDVPVAVVQQLVTEYTRRRAAGPAK